MASGSSRGAERVSWRRNLFRKGPGAAYAVSAVALTLYDLIPRGDRPGNDALLGQFLEYTQNKGLELYPAQEEAILELFQEKNVILNTPTGSGKSLVATALHFKAMSQGKRSIYTCPIKALVNEKWLALCREFGPDNVGLSTGDASVNRDAPILCCTAEILANIALREGEKANVQEVIVYPLRSATCPSSASGPVSMATHPMAAR